MMPSDFAHWKLVYYYFSSWKKKGIWEDIHESLVEKVRVLLGKNEEPTVGIIDARSVKNTLVSSEDKGFDAEKNKRHQTLHHSRYAWDDTCCGYSGSIGAR